MKVDQSWRFFYFINITNTKIVYKRLYLNMFCNCLFLFFPIKKTEKKKETKTILKLLVNPVTTDKMKHLTTRSLSISTFPVKLEY